MPVNQKFEFSGSIFGLAGRYDYLASVSNYEVTENKDLNANIILIDEKIDAAPEEVVIKESTVKNDTVSQIFQTDQAVSRKQMRKMMKAYDKEESEELEARDVVSDRTFKIDSLATRKDSAYWAARRPIPLTKKEVFGYKKEDSTYFAEKAKAEADSSKSRNGAKFKPVDILFGNNYALGEKLRFNFPGFLPQVRFNTVEGWNLDFTGTLAWRGDTTARLRISPFVRYGFASDKFYGKVETVFGIGQREDRGTFRIQGGHYIEQFNPLAIDPFINTIYTLFSEKNFMRLYEKDYANISFAKRFRYNYTFSTKLEWANRSELFNNTTYRLVDNDGRVYKPNRPVNNEDFAGGFQESGSLISRVSLEVKPWLKFRRYNGRLIPLEDSSPTLRFTYRKGYDDILGSEVNFDHLELGLKTSARLGVRARIDIDAEAGTFFNNPNLLFPDFKHFPGNRLSFSPIEVTGGYRMLDYYKYSTSDDYLSVFTHIRFRKLLFTHLPVLRLSGLKENLFVNYLTTQTSDHYMEVGYTIDNIFRFFRLEFVQSFQDFKPKDFGVRIGVASIFSFN
jgi:hypothetical protein